MFSGDRVRSAHGSIVSGFSESDSRCLTMHAAACAVLCGGHQELAHSLCGREIPQRTLPASHPLHQPLAGFTLVGCHPSTSSTTAPPPHERGDALCALLD